MARRFNVGDRIEVTEGAGLKSCTTGTVVSRNLIPVRSDGVPNLPGYYKPVDWNREVAIQYDDLSVGTMPVAYVKHFGN